MTADLTLGRDLSPRAWAVPAGGAVLEAMSSLVPPRCPMLVTASLRSPRTGFQPTLMLLRKAIGPQSRGPSAAVHPTLVHRGLPLAGRPRRGILPRTWR